MRIRRTLAGPTTALPGTAEKIRVMEMRETYQLPIFHPLDPRMYSDDCGELMSVASVKDKADAAFDEAWENVKHPWFTRDDVKEQVAGAS